LSRKDPADAEQKPVFRRHGNPTAGDIERLLARCKERVLRLVERVRAIVRGDPDGVEKPEYVGGDR